MSKRHKPELYADVLTRLAIYYGIDVSSEHILHDGLSVDLDDDEIVETISKKLNFSTKKIACRSIDKLSNLDLPCVIVTKNGPAILYNISNDGIIFEISDSKDQEKKVDKSKLAQIFTGTAYTIYVNKEAYIDSEYIEKKNHWFWDSLKFSKATYVDVLLASFLINIFALLTPLFVRSVYDRVIPNSAFDTLFVLASGMMIVYLFDMIFKFLRAYLLELAGKKSDIIISSKIFDHIMNIKLAHRYKSTGAFANNIKEFDTLRNFLSSATLTMIIDIPFAVLFLFIIYIIGGNIVLIPIAASAFIIMYALLISRPLKKMIDESSKLLSWKNGLLIESLGALETIKSFGMRSMLQWKWEGSTAEAAKVGMRSKILTSSMSTVSSFLVQASNILVIIFGVYAIYEKSLSMGGLIALTMLSSRALAPLVQISSLIVNYEYAKSSYEILDNIYKMPLDYDKNKKYISKSGFEGKIEFRGVTFSYPETSELVLDNISFVLQKGEKLGLVGANGSGKSTILKLIMGFYEPCSGTILIDDIDIKHIHPMNLREALNYLPQEITLFNSTIKENIKYANPDSSDDDIIKSIKMSGLEYFISSSPKGWDTVVEEDGRAISGGQKQSIGLSRLFVRDQPPIVLADEPTNHLDISTGALVYKNLNDFATSKTTILITHRKDILSFLDRIIVLEKGKIALDGKTNKVLTILQGGKVEK